MRHDPHLASCADPAAVRRTMRHRESLTPDLLASMIEMHAPKAIARRVPLNQLRIIDAGVRAVSRRFRTPGARVPWAAWLIEAVDDEAADLRHPVGTLAFTCTAKATQIRWLHNWAIAAEPLAVAADGKTAPGDVDPASPPVPARSNGVSSARPPLPPAPFSPPDAVDIVVGGD